MRSPLRRRLDRRARRRPLVLALAGLSALALAAAGCGSSNHNTSTTSQAKGTASVVSKLPANVKAAGSITVATSADYPPVEFIASDGSTITGLDPDLARAIGAEMGLTVKLVNAPFDSLLPGLQAGKYNVGMSGFGDTKEREKTLDFVTYFRAGTSFFVKAQGGPAINTLADLCGHTVGVLKGSTQQADATAQAKKCTGSKATVLVYPDQNSANLALSSGRVEVSMADSPVAYYQVKKSGGQFKVSGQPYGTVDYGIALPKTSGLAPAFQAAVQSIMANGKYAAVLAKWGAQQGAISAPQINGATS